MITHHCSVCGEQINEDCCPDHPAAMVDSVIDREAGRSIHVVIVRANPDADDCLSDAAERYIARWPVLSGWDLDPRWTDDATREQVTLTIPVWFNGHDLEHT